MRLLNNIQLILPPIIFLVSIGFVSYEIASQNQSSEKLRSKIKHDYLENKKNELRSHMDLALSAIKDLRQADASEEIKTEAKNKLRKLRFNAEDGYFFVYDSVTGYNLVHPIFLEKYEGQPKMDLADCNGKFVIRDLIKAAKEDGFDSYMFKKPSDPDDTNADDPCRDQRPKLGHVVILDDWNWLVGTGLYIELDPIFEKINDQIEKHTTSLWFDILIITILGGGILSIMQFQAGRKNGADREKWELAIELHDGVKQQLSYVARGLNNKSNEIAQSSEIIQRNDLQKFLEKMEHITDKALSDVITITKSLIEPEYSLVNGLREVINDFSKREEIPVDFFPTEEVDELTKKLSNVKKLALIKVTRQALDNSAHAATNRIQMQLKIDACYLSLIMIDDGCGMDIDDVNLGIGLQGMRKRMEAVSGELEINSRPGSGTTVIATVPLDRNIWKTILCLSKHLRNTQTLDQRAGSNQKPNVKL